MCLSKTKIFTIWLFMEDVCQPLYKIINVNWYFNSTKPVFTSIKRLNWRSDLLENVYFRNHVFLKWSLNLNSGAECYLSHVLFHKKKYFKVLFIHSFVHSFIRSFLRTKMWFFPWFRNWLLFLYTFLWSKREITCIFYRI